MRSWALIDGCMPLKMGDERANELQGEVLRAELAGSLEHVIMTQVERSLDGGVTHFPPASWQVVILFVLPFQRPRGSASIYTSRRIIPLNPLGNVNLTTLRSGMDRSASPRCSDATAVSTARPISGAAAATCG